MSDKLATVNHAGSLAFKMDAKTTLVRSVLTSFVSNEKYYQSGSESDKLIERTALKVMESDPVFILKLAAYARNVMHLRSISTLLLKIYSLNSKGVANTRKYVDMCIQRPDDITEVLAACLADQKRIPQFIKNGLGPCFNKFDEYQLAKYNREGSVTLKDALFICHPSAKDEWQQAIFDRLAQDKLAVPDTWEVAISTNGASKETWTEILPRMGYMALLRNINNFLKNDVDMEIVCQRLTDPAAIFISKQLPFRYLSAYKAVQSFESSLRPTESLKYANRLKKVYTALNVAMQISVQNMPHFEGSTLVLVDISGSMRNPISEKSKVTASDIATLFGAIAAQAWTNADLIIFATDYKAVNFTSNSTIFDMMTSLQKQVVGMATYAYKPIQALIEGSLYYDRVIMLTDEQFYNDGNYGVDPFAKTWLEYKSKVNPNAKLYSVDLVGYGLTTLPQQTKNTYLLAGWSEKIFDFMKNIENGENTLIKEIEEYGQTQ